MIRGNQADVTIHSKEKGKEHSCLWKKGRCSSVANGHKIGGEGLGEGSQLNHHQEGSNFHIYQLPMITDNELQKKKNASQAVHRIRRCYSWGMCSRRCTVSHGCTELVYTEKSTESLDQGLANSGTHARSRPDILLVNKVLLEASHAHSFVSSAWLILVPGHS